MEFNEMIKLWKEWRKRSLKEKLETDVSRAFDFILDQVYVVDKQDQKDWEQEDFDQMTSIIQNQKEKLEKKALEYRKDYGDFPVLYEDYISKSKYVLDKLEGKARKKAREFIKGRKESTSLETYNRLHDEEHKEANCYLAEDLNLIERIERNKPAKLKKIEARFIKESDRSFAIANIVRKGKLRKMNYRDLVELDRQYGIRAMRVDKLADGYCELIGDEEYEYTHPDFARHLNYSFLTH